MNRLVLIGLFQITTLALLSQDVILFNSGGEEEVSLKKIGVTTIEYKKANNPNGPTYEVLKQDVSQIVYANGTKDTFTKTEKPIETELEPQKGTFIDDRDGETYTWVKIGEQIWMGENLRYDNGNSPCSQSEDNDCDDCGRYYKYEDALVACPKGWFLPSDEEWMALEMHVGMSPGQAWQDGWRGTHPGQAPALKRKGSTGLDLLMCGHSTRNNIPKQNSTYDLSSPEVHGYYWTATEDDEFSNYGVARHFKDRLSIEKKDLKIKSRISVRCIKNDNNESK